MALIHHSLTSVLTKHVKFNTSVPVPVGRVVVERSPPAPQPTATKPTPARPPADAPAPDARKSPAYGVFRIHTEY